MVNMESTTKWLLTGMFCVIIIYYMAVILSDASQPNVTLEGIEFAENNTEYNTAQDGIIGLNLYYFNNETFPIGTSYYSFDTDGITLYANSSVAGYPNITTTTYYASYEWDRSETVWSIDFEFIGLLVFLAAAIVVIMKFTSTSRD